jgi:eukaryotic-like serine/threonine-protein kinase
MNLSAFLGRAEWGEVYRARDLKLKREVAIKILPDEFSRDPDRVSRFQREAEVLASLNHPNIAAIYDLQEANGSRFLVLELVEGETLAERIKRGPIPIDESLNIAKNICEALEAAHEKGVVHRDLKPANVKITPEGKVKVLDFGLAKAFESESAKAALSNSPTLSMTATNAGVILGTAAYMSPEQARGRKADGRSDVFSFGCVLYEMLTGMQAFQGEEVSDVLASVLKGEPDLGLLPANLNPRVHELLHRCLEKNANRRWQASGDLRIEIENVLANPRVEASANLSLPIARRRKREWAAWAFGLVAAAAFAAVSILHFNRAELPETYLQVVTPPTNAATSMAVSPDGRKLVFVGSNQGRQQLFLRSFASVDEEALPGTEGALYPFWSPDSRHIGFFAEAKLKRIDIPGGAVQVLANASFGVGGAWNRDGVILFVPAGAQPVFRVAADGGPAVEVTYLDSQHSAHYFPSFLPDGRHFLFYALGNPENRGVYWGDLESKETARLFDSDTAAIHSPSGYLLFVRQGTLFAQRFDAATRQLLGNAFPAGENPAFDGGTAGGTAPAVSMGAQVLAYRSGGASGNRQLVWFDRSGKQAGIVAPPDGFFSINPALSTDGQRVAWTRTVNGNRDIWLLEPARQITTRFTFDPAWDDSPIWSPDGGRIVFASDRKGIFNLYLKSSSGAGNEELLLDSPALNHPLDWSRDGRFILYLNVQPKNAADLWVLPLFGDRKPFVFLATPFNEGNAQFSPDVRWVAYDSNESGRYEIYVRPFPGPGGKWQVSNVGGSQPRWRPDGKELFYVAADGKLMSVSVETTSETFKAASPAELFATRLLEISGTSRQQYSVSPDGQRFLINVPTDSATIPPITVVLNWNPPAK